MSPKWGSTNIEGEVWCFWGRPLEILERKSLFDERGAATERGGDFSGQPREEVSRAGEEPLRFDPSSL